jgi:hypothetical protein
MSVYRYGIWISIPVFVGSTALVIRSIINVVRVIRQSQILSVPVVEEQEIEFPHAGEVILCEQGPHLSTRFAHLDYELTKDGVSVPGRRTLGHSKTSTLSWVRVNIKTYRLPTPGRYVLRITGLEPSASDDTRHSVVFMQPTLAKSLPFILGIVFGSLLFVGSIVLFFMRLS